MRDDLLHAQASVDWAVSHLPSLQKRLDAWTDANVGMAIEESEPENPYNLLVVVERDSLPLSFTVEVGAYINAIRSSLDILPTSLAHRYNMAKPDKAYFPIAASAAEFASGRSREFLKGLPTDARDIFEGLKPYDGGNAELWALHRLDILRKHQRLLEVHVRPATFKIMGWGLSRHFTLAETFMSANGNTVFGQIGIGGNLTAPPLPHHRTYGSVSGGSVDYAVAGRRQKPGRERRRSGLA